MGLPALKEQFEVLTARTYARSEEVTRAAEVVSITIGRLIKVSNTLIDTLNDVRSMLLVSGPRIRELFEQLEHDPTCATNLAGCASVMAMMQRFRRLAARPYFEDCDGHSSRQAAEKIASLKGNSADDGRNARRVAKRVREAADGCEKQRVRFVATLDDVARRYEAFIAERFEEPSFRGAYVQALAEQSIKRFPVVNAYLAR